MAGSYNRECLNNFHVEMKNPARLYVRKALWKRSREPYFEQFLDIHLLDA